jgi:hypothetical protein
MLQPDRASERASEQADLIEHLEGDLDVVLTVRVALPLGHERGELHNAEPVSDDAKRLKRCSEASRTSSRSILPSLFLSTSCERARFRQGGWAHSQGGAAHLDHISQLLLAGILAEAVWRFRVQSAGAVRKQLQGTPSAALPVHHRQEVLLRDEGVLRGGQVSRGEGT